MLRPLEPQPTALPDATDGGPRLRQCGRCRLWFEPDPDAHPTAQADWWLCPPCRVILLGAPKDQQLARDRPAPPKWRS
jgi:hypothetical protein